MVHKPGKENQPPDALSRDHPRPVVEPEPEAEAEVEAAAAGARRGPQGSAAAAAHMDRSWRRWLGALPQWAVATHAITEMKWPDCSSKFNVDIEVDIDVDVVVNDDVVLAAGRGRVV